ncbi:MAG: MATE family efflux transporter [Halieaceae bacterium]
MSNPIAATGIRFSKSTMRELLELSLPMVVSQGAFAVMVFCDRLFMSRIDAVHMAASLGGGVASFFSISLFVGVLVYANALVAQYFGAGERHKCPQVVTQGLLMAALCLPLLAIIAHYVSQLFAGMGHDPRQVELESSYYFILMWGAGFTLAKVCIASYFSGIGRTRVVMVADTLGMVLNVPLSYVLIFGKLGFPELGIDGAALGTVISSLFALVLFCAYYFQREHRQEFSVMASFRFNRAIMGRYLRLGFPSGFELFMNVASFNLFLLMFQSYGVVQGASAAIVFNWDMLSFVPMLGLNIGVISLIGRFVGANDMARADEVISAGFLLALGYAGVLAVLFVVFRVELVTLFAGSGADGNDIVQLSSFMMVGLASYVMADAAILISGGVLRGAGDTRWMMVTSISLHWLMLLAQYFIIMVYDWNERVSWLTFVLMILLIAVVYVGRLRGNVWREPERLAKVMAE